MLALCNRRILYRINTAVFGARETIFATDLCHIRPSNRPLTSCLSESYLAGNLCEWMAVPCSLENCQSDRLKALQVRTMVAIRECYQPVPN